MVYVTQTWRNDASGLTPINAARLQYMEAGIAAAHALIPGTSSGAVYRVSVKDYGAKGDGTTDDTASIIAARNACLATLINAEVSRELYFPAGVYKVTQQDALLSSPTTSPAAVNGYWITGDRKRGSQIDFSSTVGASVDNFAGNLMTAANRVLRLRIKNIRFNSTNANQSFFYGWNSAATTGGQLFPQYGAGHNNQDFYLEDVEWTGSWKRGIGLDGDWNTNLNSEWVFMRCHHSNSARWSDAFLRSGINKATSSGTDPATHPMTSGEGWNQQDQYLNFDFYSCKFEGAAGDIIKMDKGGAVRVYGGSWIYFDAAGVGTFFKMGINPAGGTESHVDSVMFLSVYGTRFELRSPTNKLLELGWYSRRAHVSFDTVSTDSQAFRSWAAEAEQITIRARNNDFPQVRFTNCGLMGTARIKATSSPTGGRVVFDQCHFANWTTGLVGTTNTYLRHDGTVPLYRFRDCAGVTDAVN